MKFLLVSALVMWSLSCDAQQVRATTVGTSSRATQQTSTSQSQANLAMVDEADIIAQQVWGLTADELKRAKVLLKGPRANFSVPNLSPVEALGIHARSDAERQKYAEKFAKAQHDDTERVLAWAVAYQVAMQRLYPNEKVVEYAGSQPIDVSVGAADAANVPRAIVRQGLRVPGAKK